MPRVQTMSSARKITSIPANETRSTGKILELKWTTSGAVAVARTVTARLQPRDRRAAEITWPASPPQQHIAHYPGLQPILQHMQCDRRDGADLMRCADWGLNTTDSGVH